MMHGTSANLDKRNPDDMVVADLICSRYEALQNIADISLRNMTSLHSIGLPDLSKVSTPTLTNKHFTSTRNDACSQRVIPLLITGFADLDAYTQIPK